MMKKYKLLIEILTILFFSFIFAANAMANDYYCANVTAYVVQRTGTSVYGGYGGTVMVQDSGDDQSYSTTSSGTNGNSFWVANGGDPVNLVMKASPNNGYSFSGWFGNSADVSPISTDSPYTGSYVTANLRGKSNASEYYIYAKFSPIDYTISFSANGGTGTSPSSITYNIESTDKSLPSCSYTRSGYTFTGWKPSSNVGNWGTSELLSSGYSVEARWGTVQLNAQWAPKDYTITYNPNGGTLDTPGNQTYTIESTDALKTVTRTGYTFMGWKVTAVETEGNWTVGETAASNLSSKYGNITLTAQWAVADITISVSGLQTGESAIFTVKKGSTTIYTVSLSSTNPSTTIKDQEVGASYTVTPTNWSWTYSMSPTSSTQTLPSTGYTFSFTATKNTSAKYHDEKSNVNWRQP